MAREIEKAGIPVVHMACMVPVAQSMGVNRIIKTLSIPYPMCDVSLSEEAQYKQRYQLLSKALDVLTTDISQQTVFTTL